MNHIGTQYIETDRLILRRFELSDAQAMFNNWASDDEVTKYLTWPSHIDVSMAKQVLTDWTNSYLKENFYHWAIVLKKIEACHDSRNTNSGAVMRKCGMKYEGTRKKADWDKQGELCDLCDYVIECEDR